jgi:hypothetical protein
MCLGRLHERRRTVPECALTEGCIFFNDKMASMPSMANMYKQRYCHEDFEACARFRVLEVVGRENVPKDLYPNDVDKVDAAIAQAQAGETAAE